MSICLTIACDICSKIMGTVCIQKEQLSSFSDTIHKCEQCMYTNYYPTTRPATEPATYDATIPAHPEVPTTITVN